MRDLALVWDAHAKRSLVGWQAKGLSRVILAPVRLFQYLVATAVILLIAALVLGLAASLILPQWPVTRAAASIAVLLVLIGIVFRHLTGPLVTHFGTASGDTHGSARFATDRETADAQQHCAKPRGCGTRPVQVAHAASARNRR